MAAKGEGDLPEENKTLVGDLGQHESQAHNEAAPSPPNEDIDEDGGQKESIDEDGGQEENIDEDGPHDHQDLTSRGARKRTLTARGLANQLDIKQPIAERAYRKAHKKLQTLQELILHADVSNEQLRVVRLEYFIWLTDFEKYLDACKSLLDVPGVAAQTQNWVHSCDATLRAGKGSIETWLNESSTKLADQAVSESRGSRRSVTGSSSSSNSRVTVMSARLKEEQKKAEIAARMTTLQEQQDLEQHRFKLQQQEEALRLRTELAVSEAKTKVLDKFDELFEVESKGSSTRSENNSKLKCQHFVENGCKNSDVVCKDSNVVCKDSNVVCKNSNDGCKNSNATFVNVTQRSNAGNGCQNSPVDVWQSSKNENDVIDCNVSNVDNLCQRVETDSLNLKSVIGQLKRPPTVIDKFSGDALQYRKFVRQFNTLITVNCTNFDEKMNFLEQFTDGDARKIVSAYSYLESEDAYKTAWIELEDRYGNSENIADTFIQKALRWPFIKADNPEGLDHFSIFLAECGNAIRSIEAMKQLEYPENLRRCVQKLPMYIQDRWRNLVFDKRKRGEDIKFRHLQELVKTEAKKANDKTYGRKAMTIESYNSQSRDTSRSTTSSGTNKIQVRSFAANAEAVEPVQARNEDFQRKPSCYFCDSQDHFLGGCESFSSQQNEIKIEFLKSKGCCFGCLRRGHQKKDCKRKSTCSVCGKPHPTALHVDRQPDQPPVDLSSSQNTEQSSFAEVIGARGSTGAGQECAMAIVPVKVKLKNGSKMVETYAFMDPGSSATFCTETLMKQIGATGKRVEVTLDTMGRLHHMKSFVLNNLEVYDISNPGSRVQLSKVYTKDRMPVSAAHVPTQKDIDDWPHLQKVELKNIAGKVELLIGNNVPDAYSPLEIKTGPSGSPHAVKSRLGWIVWNLMRPAKVADGPLAVNHVDVLAIEKLEEIQKLTQFYKQAVNRDFPENLSKEKKEHSQQDKLFLERISSSTELRNGHYQISPLVGSKRELQEALQECNSAKVQQNLVGRGIEWQFNPPAASHFGGMWERMIRTVRKLLYSLLKEQVLKLGDEGLATLFCEAEAVLNNRPLTYISDDVNDLEPLTPNHLLLAHKSDVQPVGHFTEHDNYTRRKWRQVQYLADIFWRRWLREYLPILQERQKWFNIRKNLEVGDIVLVLDNSPRNTWPLARVLEVKPDKHGLVRIVKLKTSSTVLERPVHKLCLVLEVDNSDM